MKKTIVFFRHAIPDTKSFDLKKGIKFLGRKENPSIITPDKEEILNVKKELFDFDIFFSSPMKRCKETISLLTERKIIETPLLLEIDYGDIDGLYSEEVKKKFIYLLDGWSGGKDIRFPNGENNLDVIKRIKLFINEIKRFKKNKIAVCTHNVFLRCLIGSALKIPVKKWFKIDIPYFEPIKFVLKKDKLEYIGSLEQKNKLLKNIFSRQLQAYFIALIPEKELYLKIYKTKKEIFQRFGNQKYLKDPPHVTLYVSLAENLKKVEEIIQDTILKQKPINFSVLNEYQEFKEDKFAGGGTSIALKFNDTANKNIIDLQKKLITKLNPLREDKIHPRYTNSDLPITLKNNINKYGFPFAGEIFIPHINFCSFNPTMLAEKFKQSYPTKEFSGNFKFNKIGLFRLYLDDKTELIESFEL